MLDAYIIDQIRKREDERRRIYDRPAVSLPLPLEQPPPRRRPSEDVDEDTSRVIVIDL